MAGQLNLSLKISADGKAAAGEIQRVERQLNKVRPSTDRARSGLA